MISVSVRALLTFIVFYFVSDIIYFIIIELFIQVFILLFLLYLFNKNEFRLFVKSNVIECTSDSEMVNYGKKMFLTSFVSFISAHILSFIISITLSASDIGAYNILLTLTGLSTFLLINLNKVFAPAISKLYSSNNFFELNKLYKKTTFLINLITVPFVVTIAFFADEILSLYTLEMVEYKEHLFFMLVGGLLSLTAGSSGTLMVMAGLEKSNLYVQFSRALLLIILSFIFIPFFKMKAVVILYTLFMFFVNFIQVLLLNKHLNISPFSNELVFIIVITFFAMTFAILQDYEFSFLHFIIIPISLYLFYFSIMYKPFKRILNQLK